MNQVSLNSEEMKKFFHHIISNNRHIQAQGKRPVAAEIIGESGLGKTSVALQLANELDLNFVKLNLAQIEELGDLVGFPVRQFELSKEDFDAGNTTEKRMVKKTVTKEVMKQVKEGDKFVLKKVPVEVEEEVEETFLVPAEGDGSMWADENAIDEYLKQGYSFTGNKRMSYCPPEWIADKKGGGILILDDWNRADIRFIQAVMELVDRQEYISWKLPKDWHIILTANPDNGEYLVNTIDTAQKTRFVSIEMKWDHETWAQWAENDGIDSRCINFVLMHPEVISTKVNPRSMTTFFNCISSIEDFEQDLPLIQMVGEGSVGPEAATLFTTFINNRLDKIISPKEILLEQDEKKVIQGMKDCIGEGNDYRADIASILTTRVINYGIKYAESNPIDQAVIDRLNLLVTDPDVLTDDLKYVLVKKVLNGNKQKFQKMLVNKDVQELATK